MAILRLPFGARFNLILIQNFDGEIGTELNIIAYVIKDAQHSH